MLHWYRWFTGYRMPDAIGQWITDAKLANVMLSVGVIVLVMGYWVAPLVQHVQRFAAQPEVKNNH